jgi:tryptophanase
MRSRERLIIPYRSKVIEPISLPSREERLERIETAGLNVFRLRSADVYIDLLTDSGTGAISAAQLSRSMLGDESYAGSRSFEEMQQQIQKTMGFPYTIPVHQGRAAEQVLNYVLIRPHMFVPGNTHFDTTKAHIELAQGRAIDCTIDAGKTSEGNYPFKGNVAVSKLEQVIEKYGARHIAYILMTITCNSGGGQPVSMQNIRDVRALASAHGLPLIFDIIHEMMGYADGCTMSAKKDAIVPMGGFIACRDPDLYERLKTPAIIFEGYFTYGGMSGGDMEMLAQGLREVVDENYLAYRIGQVRRLGELLQSYGIPVVEPIGGHAVFIDARRFFTHVPDDEFPAQLLCAELYKEGGVRAVEVGAVLTGRDPDTGENIRPALDLCRLCIPRRVYTFEHLEYVADVIRTVREEKGTRMKRGICFDHEAEGIRHFSSTFRYL